MRKFNVVVVAAGVLAGSAALAATTYPQKVTLPNAFAPEGIEIAKDDTFYVGSVQSGGIYMGNLRTGSGRTLVEGASTAGVRGATGIEYDRGRLWVAGAGYGTARVYDASTGALQREYQLAAPPGTFINDVVLTRKAAFFTDSQRPVLYRIALSKNGLPGALTTIALSGEYQHVAGQLNLNGIVATADEKMLIGVQTFARKLILINPSTGGSKAIDIGRYDLANGDGLLLQGATRHDGLLLPGSTLHVVQNRSNRVAVFWLAPSLTRATFRFAITDPDFDVPTTIDRAGKRLYVVNARFGTATPANQSYHVVKAG